MDTLDSTAAANSAEEESILPDLDLDLDLVVLPSESDSESAALCSPAPAQQYLAKAKVNNDNNYDADDNNNNDDDEVSASMIKEENCEMILSNLLDDDEGGDRDPLGDPDPDPAKVYVERPYVCSEPDCAQAYRRKESLRLHVRTVHRGEEKPLNKCRQCGEAFAHRRNRLEHEKSHHSITSGGIGSNTTNTNAAAPASQTGTGTAIGPKFKRNRLEPIQVTSGTVASTAAAAAAKTGTGTGSDLQFKCQYCQKSFLKAGALRRHELNMHLLETQLQQRQPQAPLTCATCGKIFRVASQLAYHSLIHSASRPRFYCDRCPANFGRKDYLKLHLEAHGEKKFKCRHDDICDANFTRKCYRDRHELVHTKVKDYLCEICSKTFPTSSALAMHRRNHVGTKPHKCEHCGATYTQRGNLKYHVLSKHTKTEDRKYVCPVCPDKRFLRQFDLDVHLKATHVPKIKLIKTGSSREERDQELVLKCDLCHYRFRTKIQLKSHRKIKHGRLDELPGLVPVPVLVPAGGTTTTEAGS